MYCCSAGHALGSALVVGRELCCIPGMAGSRLAFTACSTSLLVVYQHCLPRQTAALPPNSTQCNLCFSV